MDGQKNFLSRKIFSFPRRVVVGLVFVLPRVVSMWWWKFPLRFGQETRWIRVYGKARLLVRRDDARARRIARLGGSQPEKIAVFRAAAMMRPEVIIDVGANYGEFVAATADLGIATIAVEPNSAIAACLETTTKVWRHVQVRREAIGDGDSETTFYIDAHESGSASLIADVPASGKNAPNRATLRPMRVSLRKLDTLIPECLGHFPQSCILKIDVEGGELGALRGAQELLASARWWRALVEFCPTVIRASSEDPRILWDFLRQFPGIIIRPHQAPPSFNLHMALPTDPPEEDCDVFVGVGGRESL